MVGEMGFEPTRLSTSDFKSAASAIPPLPHANINAVLCPSPCIRHVATLHILFGNEYSKRGCLSPYSRQRSPKKYYIPQPQPWLQFIYP